MSAFSPFSSYWKQIDQESGSVKGEQESDDPLENSIRVLITCEAYYEGDYEHSFQCNEDGFGVECHTLDIMLAEILP